MPVLPASRAALHCRLQPLLFFLQALFIQNYRLTFTFHTTLMRGLNKATLIGNLGKDPELKVLEGQISVARFTLATSEVYTTTQGERKTDTTWHTVVLWRGLADLAAKYLHKGSLVYVEGKIKTRSYDDAAGTKRYVTEIEADQFLMLDKPQDNHGTN